MSEIDKLRELFSELQIFGADLQDIIANSSDTNNQAAELLRKIGNINIDFANFLKRFEEIADRQNKANNALSKKLDIGAQIDVEKLLKRIEERLGQIAAQVPLENINAAVRNINTAATNVVKFDQTLNNKVVATQEAAKHLNYVVQDVSKQINTFLKSKIVLYIAAAAILAPIATISLGYVYAQQKYQKFYTNIETKFREQGADFYDLDMQQREEAFKIGILIYRDGYRLENGKVIYTKKQK